MSHKKDLKKLAKLLNRLEAKEKNPTPIRRPPDAKGGLWVMAMRTNKGSVIYVFPKEKWIVTAELEGEFQKCHHGCVADGGPDCVCDPNCTVCGPSKSEK